MAVTVTSGVSLGVVLPSGASIMVVTNYAALPSASAHSGEFAWVENSTGIPYINRRISGLYYSNGSSWEYSEISTDEATQIAVDTSGFTHSSSGDVQTVLDDLDAAIGGNSSSVTVVDAGGDTTTFPLLGTSATGNLTPATDSGLTYNATTNNLTSTTFTGALTGNASTATALQTPRTIGGVSFDGTVNIVPQTIESANEATDITCFPLFITASGTQQLQPKNNTGLTYNSNTNNLGASTFTGALTGNASTATALQNARTIGGVSFDGTANIVPQTIQTVDDTSDTTCFLLFGNASGSQSQQPKTNSGLAYNASTNNLTATTFTGALSGNSTTATTATNVTVANEATDTTCFPLFATDATGNLGAKSNANLIYNSNTGAFGITGQLNVDNLRLDGNTLSTTDTNGNLLLTPNGTGSTISALIKGSTSSAGTLTLSSTTNATKGKILLGTASAYDEANDMLGIGTTSPSLSKIQAVDANTATAAVNVQAIYALQTANPSANSSAALRAFDSIATFDEANTRTLATLAGGRCLVINNNSAGGSTTTQQGMAMQSLVGPIFGAASGTAYSQTVMGLTMQAVQNSNTSSTVATVNAAYFAASQRGSNTTTQLVSGLFDLTMIGGTATNGRILWCRVSNDIGNQLTGGTITNTFLVDIEGLPSGGSTFTNTPVQLRIQAGATASIAIQQQGANNQNRFEGSSTFGADAAPSSGSTINIQESDGNITFTEDSATPANPTSNTECRIYMKADKFVIQFNNAGTVRYKYLDLTGTGVTWTHTTSAP